MGASHKMRAHIYIYNMIYLFEIELIDIFRPTIFKMI